MVNKPEINSTPAVSEALEMFTGKLLSSKKHKLYNESIDDDQDINDLKRSFNTMKSNMAHIQAARTCQLQTSRQHKNWKLNRMDQDQR